MNSDDINIVQFNIDKVDVNALLVPADSNLSEIPGNYSGIIVDDFLNPT